MKTNDEDQSNKMRREKSRGVQCRLRGERKKRGQRTDEPPFFIYFFLFPPHAALAASTWERRGGRAEAGRLGGGTCRGSGLMNTAAWQSCSILWPHTKHHPFFESQVEERGNRGWKNKMYLELLQNISRKMKSDEQNRDVTNQNHWETSTLTFRM